MPPGHLFLGRSSPHCCLSPQYSPHQNSQKPIPYLGIVPQKSVLQSRVFGCACYPNLSSQRPHKLASRSTRCVFLGYLPQHRGYWCLDLATNKIIISRHVTFDESKFPFASFPTHSSAAYSFLDPSFNLVSPIILDNVHPSPTNTSPTPRTPNNPPRSPQQPSPTPHHTPTPPPPPPPLIHTMTTRGMNGIFKPRALTTSSTSPISPLPKSPHLALRDQNWNAAMQDEYRALLDNHMWD